MLAILRRTGVVGAFPDGKSAVMVFGLRLQQVVSTHALGNPQIYVDGLAATSRYGGLTYG